MCKLFSLLQFLDEAGEGFSHVVWYHHSDSVFFQVDLADFFVGQEEMIHHIQGRALAKTYQLVLDWVQEDGLHSIGDMFFERPVDIGVPS